jgi:sulfatase modifying factor 1
VVCVSWDDAAAYVKWLSGHTGEAYRLLSEAEWEYAARGGTTTMRYWGHDWNNEAGCAYANVMTKEHWATGFDCKDGYKNTSPVGTYKANAFGLDDTLGNVWEWVEDCFKDNYTGAHSDGSAWTSGDCSRRVLRGGSWDFNPRLLRSSFRLRNGTDDRGSVNGFRVARTLPR